MYEKAPKNFIDLTGKTFKNWQVVERDEEKTKLKNRAHWLCQCICGVFKVIESGTLRLGKVRDSCGCIKKERISKIQTTEDKQKKRIKNIWRLMKSRCYSDKHIEYFRYGGSGITVTDEWHEFGNFYRDMFDSYVVFESEYGLNSATIDRIDSTGNYEPSNCRWLTLQQQARNRKDNLSSTVNGKHYGTLIELIEDYPTIPYSVAQYRYVKGQRNEQLIAPYSGRAKNKNEQYSSKLKAGRDY